jgi:Na+-transporting methylmalonyl-CoA/oxaloacetate decarboxylase gamma subunit
MSIEALVSFIVFLFLALLALAIRWLNERIRRDIALRDLKDLFLPTDDSREQRDREAPDTTRTSPSKPKQPIQKFRPTISPKRRTASRLRLRNRADLRQGIIIMTVLGPCRALEHPDD